MKQREQRSLADCWQLKADGQCSKGDNCSFRYDMNKRTKSTQTNPSAGSSSQQSVKNASLDGPARITSKELSQLHSVKNGIFQSVCSASQTKDADRQVDEQPCKKSKKSGDKSAVAILQISRQLGCVCQDMGPPKSSSILRKSSNILKPIRCVQFTKAILRHANIRNQNPSLGMICPGEL